MYQKTFAFPQIISRSMRKADISVNNKSINECLGILLRTRPGEMIGDPNWGCMLIERIFMYQGVIIERLIVEDILNAVSKYEPRITISSNDIQMSTNNQILSIYIQYTIKETGEVNSYNLDISPDDNPFV
jgi:phage baseplate assembly protein W